MTEIAAKHMYRLISIRTVRIRLTEYNYVIFTIGITNNSFLNNINRLILVRWRIAFFSAGTEFAV